MFLNYIAGYNKPVLVKKTYKIKQTCQPKVMIYHILIGAFYYSWKRLLTFCK